MAIVALAFLAAVTFLDISSFLKVLLGLSFVIFIHELGHFLVAKMCDVHVTHFSIGFGPAIPGCKYQWGETTYQLCLLPLGGYVQMVGQVDGDESSDGSETDPRSYRNKSVGQRMAIISAGVIMNVILALVLFIAIYRGPGYPRRAAVIGAVEPGGPADIAGMRTGMEIQEIGGIQHPYFDDLQRVVAGSSAGEPIKIVVQRPSDAKPTELFLEPRKGKTDDNPVLGVSPAASTTLATEKRMSPDGPVTPGSAASRAEPPFEYGDVVVATTDPADPSRVTELPPDPLKPEQKNYFEYLRRMQLLASQEVTVKVKRGDNEVAIKIPPGYHNTVGAVMEMGHIVAIRKGFAAEGKIQLATPAQNGNPSLEADLIEKVEVVDAKGQPLVFEKATLDPVRLPSQLRQWAQKLVDADKIDGAKVTLTVRRHRAKQGPQFEPVKVELPWDNSWQFDRVSPYPFSLYAPTGIAELGLAYQVKSTIAAAPEGSELKAGDVIKNIQYFTVDAKGKENTPKWADDDVRSDAWAYQGVALATAPNLKKVKFKVDRNKTILEVEVTPTRDEAWPVDRRGETFMVDLRREKADTTIEAITFGLRDTWRMMTGIVNGIRQMIINRISAAKNLGGPLTIGLIAYDQAGSGFSEFLYFLAMISVNLAVINFLPIPVLDGGHMVFLLYEKLRGKPASEGIRMAATYMGLAFILCLIVFVTYLDIGRMLRG